MQRSQHAVVRVRILLLTFYFRPDLSAGSFRATALVQALRERLAPGDCIDVVTTEPNRYRLFEAGSNRDSEESGVEIHRIALPPHSSDMLGQARAFRRFASEAKRITRGRQYDLVYATSSRLMTAALGAHLAARARAPLYLDIRDLFVDTIGDILPRAVAGMARGFFSLIERYAMSRAETVNLVSRGFESYFTARYPRTRLNWFTNGIDEEFLAAAPASAAPRPAGRRLRVLYAGNIGEGQGLHAIVPKIAQRLGDRAEIVVIGDGGRRAELLAAVAAAGVHNVEVRPPVKRAQLLEEYRAADVLFLHLNDHRAFERVLPSKIFEYAALGKPVWAGVAGFAAAFLRQEVDNAAVFAPCDVEDAMRGFELLRIADEPRMRFIQKFSRSGIMRSMAGDVLGTRERIRR
jgi:glycosyltransferase involved in cell wall biosynthesis